MGRNYLAPAACCEAVYAASIIDISAAKYAHTCLWFKCDDSTPRRISVLKSAPRRKSMGTAVLDDRHMNVARLSALRTGRLYPQGIPRYSFLLEADANPRPWCGRKD